MHVMPRIGGVWFEPEFTLLAQAITFYGTQEEVEAILVELRAKAVKMIERGARTMPDGAVGAIGLAAE